MAGRRALDPLRLGLGRQERDAERHGLLGAGHVAGGRGDAHERLELPLGHDEAGGVSDGASNQPRRTGFTKWKLVMRMPVLR